MQQTNELGKRIAARRKARKIKQNILADKLQISNNHLSAIENGKENPSLETLLNLCEELQVTPDYLLFGKMYSNNVPKYIAENLRLCRQEDIELVKEMVEILVERNQEDWNKENYS